MCRACRRLGCALDVPTEKSYKWLDVTSEDAHRPSLSRAGKRTVYAFAEGLFDPLAKQDLQAALSPRRCGGVIGASSFASTGLELIKRLASVKQGEI